ncbi:MAG: KTSC domain-containing protein [Thaumarchaeota archaeon]|nr:KTSC domain-containing protein [Nitrososphaerota archaeon]
MLWVPVLSTEMSHARYDPDSGALHVRLLSGEVYEYYGVPRRSYDMLLAAPSKGRYFHEHIKGKYNFARVR